MITSSKLTQHVEAVRNVMARGDAEGGEVKGKQAIGEGSHYSCTLPRNMVYPWSAADPHSSTYSTELTPLPI